GGRGGAAGERPRKGPSPEDGGRKRAEPYAKKRGSAPKAFCTLTGCRKRPTQSAASSSNFFNAAYKKARRIPIFRLLASWTFEQPERALSFFSNLLKENHLNNIFLRLTMKPHLPCISP
ncbi:MAG: hypothetical protein K8I01_08770, partial [Candidatus Methylomirabilis sp.]|nr:hypothetical protein [Deltaproteobacteria bacterium]